jgi:hypothetical protein
MPQLFDQPFDANQVKPNESFEALPAGWYNARIIGSEAKPTKDNLSGYLQFELEIIDGEYRGRKIFDRLNLWNKGPNGEKTCEIAHRQLSAYCHATGVFILQASEQLHGIPVKIKLAVRPASEGYDAQNDVKAVKHIQDATSAPAGNSFAAPAAAPAPFGMNPQLPAQPSAPAFVPPAQPAALPAQIATPWGGMPAQPAPIAQPVAQPAWTPPAAPMQQPAPAAGPVPPWRR